tara:strand:- start:3631 stop:3825 length:195 start_codon:yes stop_codon:yes gene_type:complete
MKEKKHYFKVRYATKFIEIVLAHSKWEAIEKVYSKNIDRYKWIQRSKFTAVRDYNGNPKYEYFL